MIPFAVVAAIAVAGAVTMWVLVRRPPDFPRPEHDAVMPDQSPVA